MKIHCIFYTCTNETPFILDHRDVWTRPRSFLYNNMCNIPWANNDLFVVLEAPFGQGRDRTYKTQSAKENSTFERIWKWWDRSACRSNGNYLARSEHFWQKISSVEHRERSGKVFEALVPILLISMRCKNTKGWTLTGLALICCNGMTRCGIKCEQHNRRRNESVRHNIRWQSRSKQCCREQGRV